MRTFSKAAAPSELTVFRAGAEIDPKESRLARIEWVRLRKAHPP